MNGPSALQIVILCIAAALTLWALVASTIELIRDTKEDMSR